MRSLTPGHASLYLFSSLVALVLISGAYTEPRESTKFSGIKSSIRKNKIESGDDLQYDAVSTASITTSTVPVQGQVLVPVEGFAVHGAGFSGASGFASESVMASLTASETISKLPGVFVRPEGPLPVPGEHFGYETPRPIGPGSLPNCGCVSRGACLGEVGAYTRSVLPYTDVACGLTFQPCCFDGPWAGSYDSFAEAAACVPKEQCARPYGVLPTDIRDFGVIAPCPGQGAVRCLVVSSEELLVFQAAVAAIDAANAYNAHNAYHVVHPMQFLVPMSGSGSTLGATTIEATATASVSRSEDDEDRLLCEDEEKVNGRCPSHITILPVSLPEPTVVVQQAAPAQPNVVVHSAPAQPNIIVQPAAPAQPNILVSPAQPNIVVNPAQPNIVVNPAQPNVVVNPSQPNILVNPAQPNIIVNPAQPDIHFHQAQHPAQPDFHFHQAASPQPNINIQVHAPEPPVASVTATFVDGQTPAVAVPAPPGIPPTVVTPPMSPPVIPPVVAPPVVPLVVAPPVVIPPAAIPGYIGTGGYYGATGYPYPWGGFGFGKGFSLRKRISFNKGGFIAG